MMLAVPLALSASPAIASAPRSLAVSVPSEPTRVAKGETTHIPIRVLNPGTQPVSFSITDRQVVLGNDGQVNIGDGADPAWLGRVQFAPAAGTIGAQQYVEVVVTVDVPSTIISDLHFVGFLVSPVANAQGQVTVINQIGSFVTLDVPGSRTALLDATLDISGFTLGRQATGDVHVANVGQSSVRFWGESDTTSWPAGSSPTQQRFETSLSPGGAIRTVSVSAKPAWLLGFVWIKGRIVYSSTSESSTTEITFARRVFVVDPRLILVVAAILALALCGWYFRRRRRTPRTNPLTDPHQPPTNASSEQDTGGVLTPRLDEDADSQV